MKVVFDPELIRRTSNARRDQLRRAAVAWHREWPWFNARCDEHGERMGLKLQFLDGDGADPHVVERLHGCCKQFEHDVSCQMERLAEDRWLFWDEHEGQSLAWWKWQVQRQGAPLGTDWFHGVSPKVVGQWAVHQARPQIRRRLAQVLAQRLFQGRFEMPVLEVLAAIEDHCEGKTTCETVRNRWTNVWASPKLENLRDPYDARSALTRFYEPAGDHAAQAIACTLQEYGKADPAFAARVQDVAGLPFFDRPCVTAWRTPAVLGIAQRAYEEDAHDLLPVLGDALEEACGPEEVIRHCRETEEHAHGCWALDWVLREEGRPGA